MSSATGIYHRTAYAAELAQQLLHPAPLFQGVRSGVFLHGMRRVGKTTFLRQDLIPALEARGAIVIYVDLRADPATNPAALVRDAIGAKAGITLAQAFETLVEQARTDVVLIVDEVQQALVHEEHHGLLHALKAARDAVNTKPGTPGHFIFLGTGSHKSLVTDMATRRSQPFTGALAANYTVLGEDFVRWQMARLADMPGVRLPSEIVAWQGFQTLGHRPEELLRALVQLQQTTTSAPDEAFPTICSTLAAAAADEGLRAMEDFGALRMAIFGRIAAGGERGASELFGVEALVEYSTATSLSVGASQAQGLVEKLIAANLVTWLGHGVYAVTDPFVGSIFAIRAVRK